MKWNLYLSFILKEVRDINADWETEDCCCHDSGGVPGELVVWSAAGEWLGVDVVVVIAIVFRV